MDSFTVIAPSGNLCSVKIAGVRARIAAVNAEWDCPPSAKDTEFLLLWFQRNYPEYGRAMSIRVENADLRARAIDQLLYGGGRS